MRTRYAAELRKNEWSFIGSSFSGDRRHQRGKLRDAALHAVSRDHRPDARGCTGINEISGAELEQRRELGDQLGDAPDEVRYVRVLADFAVDRKPDAAAEH